mgnify:CR=1 FL=1
MNRTVNISRIPSIISFITFPQSSAVYFRYCTGLCLPVLRFALLPLVTGVVLVALAAPPVLGGLVLSGKSVQFNFSKINPLSGLKRLFSAQVVAELVKAIMKTALMGSVAAFYLWHKWPEIMRLMMEAPVTAMASALNLAGMCCLLVVLSIIPMVGFDVFWQIYSHLKKLRKIGRAHV